jgi:hypothetical protein
MAQTGTEKKKNIDGYLRSCMVVRVENYQMGNWT